MTARGRCLGAAAAGLMVVGLGVIWLAPATAQNTPHRPDVKRGAEIAAQGTANGAAACAQCHPFDGPSVGGGAFPRIDGQSTYYLAQQIADFASGVRDNAIMSPIAKALSPDEIADVAAYYAGINAAFPPAEGAAPALIQRGEQLAKVGSAAKDLQACDNCHGPGGIGLPPAIPYLAGQYAQYIASELQMWQRGERKNSLETMSVIATKLDEQDIAALAAYYQQVRAPPKAAGPK